MFPEEEPKYVIYCYNIWQNIYEDVMKLSFSKKKGCVDEVVMWLIWNISMTINHIWGVYVALMCFQKSVCLFD